MATTTCQKCNAWLDRDNVCPICGWDAKTADSEKSIEELRKEILEKAKKIQAFTTPNPQVLGKFEEIGIVFGTSSKQAFWGLSTQANRLERAYDGALNNIKYEAALLEADAVIGVSFSLNNSEGSGNKLVTGSSEAVMLIGTAVKFLR